VYIKLDKTDFEVPKEYTQKNKTSGGDKLYPSVQHEKQKINMEILL
jgi:hypothetical protein